jgi:copper homeostasis protein
MRKYMRHYSLEVGAKTVDDALAAERGGADRVELYSSPKEGALTPGAGLIQAAAEAVTTLQLYVMIRPRAGDFLYSESEFNTMQRDVEIALEMGADGIMCGCLSPDGSLDVKRMKDLKKRSGDKKFTLHRAFDFARDQLRSLEEAIDIGCDHVLTIGQAKEATFSKDMLQEVITRAEGRTKVMIALGADFDTAADMADTIRQFNVRDFHVVNGYRTRESHMRFLAQVINQSDDYLKDAMNNIDYLSEAAVREVRDILDKLKK